MLALGGNLASIGKELLRKLLASCTALKEFRLYDCEDDDIGDAFFESLVINGPLEKIDLSEIGIVSKI